MAPRVNRSASVGVLRVFYRDYTSGASIGSAQPESLPADRVEPLARRLMAGADNFLGVVDGDDVILQCYPADDGDRVVLELIYPEATGCLRLVMQREEAFARLRDLPERFDENLLQGANYID